MKKEPLSFITALFFVLVLAQAAIAQTTAISYQGSLQSGGGPASGNHDFEFALFDAPGGGNQLGSVVSINNVPVTNGVFSVQLDFGNQFPGANRFLEIRVRPAGQPGITVLSPRQLFNSSPYSVKSLTAETATTATNSTQLGGVAANQFVVTTDPRMTDARAPTVGSTNYIQNTVTPQGAANFNVSGDGAVGGTLSASIVRANTQFNIGNNRILSMNSGLYLGVNSGNLTMTGTANTFLGNGAGSDNTTGFSNTFVGQAGGNNTTGNENSFFGYAAGSLNSTGNDNAFFGRSAGHNNSTGSSNSFFGYAAGNLNTTAGSNSFFGYRAGNNNTGGGNAFFGASAGQANTTGLTNSFFGVSAGESNTIGQNNAFFGANAGAANTTALGNSFFGANAGAANSTAMGNSFFGVSAGLVNNGANNSFFGTVAGVANSTGFNNSFFGHWAGHDNTNGSSNAYFGAFAGEANTTGDNNAFFGARAGEVSTSSDNAFFGYQAGSENTSGFGNTFFGRDAGNANTTGDNNTIIGNGADVSSGDLNFATAIGAGANVLGSNSVQIGRHNLDSVRIGDFPGSGSTPVCKIGNTLTECSSSLRYKENVQPLMSGLDLIARLRPVRFDWKDRNETDLGLIAEEVAEVEPLLATHNKSGTIEGVKYDQLTVVLINAVNEQQAQIESQAARIKRQQAQIDALMKIVCASNTESAICKEGQ